MSCVTYTAVHSSSRPHASSTAMAKSWTPPLPLHNPSALGRCPSCWTSLRLRHHPSFSTSPPANFHLQRPTTTLRHARRHLLRETRTRTICQLPPSGELKALRRQSRQSSPREKQHRPPRQRCRRKRQRVLRMRNRLPPRHPQHLLQPRSAAPPPSQPLLRRALRSAALLPLKPQLRQRSAADECIGVRCRRRIRPFPSPRHLRPLQPRHRHLCCGPRRRRRLVRLRRFCFNIRAQPSLHAMELRGGRRTSLTTYPLRARVSAVARSR